MLRRTITFTCIFLVPVIFFAATQEVSAPVTAQPELAVGGIEIAEQQDIYGQVTQVALGQLANNASSAYTSISLTAAVYGEDDAQIGEGFGFLVDACGAGLLPDFSLQPDHAQPFQIALELYEADAAVDRVEVEATGTAVETLEDAAALPEGFTQITDQEVVEVEWNGPRSLRFAVGCARDLFTDWSWNSYSTLTATQRPIEHPSADALNDTLREQLGLTDPLLLANAFIRFAPSGNRLVYQNAINTLYTAAPDGSLQRALFSRLNNRTLQEIYWLDDDRFLAYYYGAYGDPVIYFTADAEGRFISPSPLENPESVIAPGASRDGRRAVIAGTFDGVTGYYLDVLTYQFFELLFEAEPPGNNWPAPLPIVDTEEDLVTHVYVARPEDGQPMLQCFNRDEGVLHDLAPLPLNLTEGDRAQWWMSPDERQIALAASGINGGLWLIDLNTLPACQS